MASRGSSAGEAEPSTWPSALLAVLTSCTVPPSVVPPVLRLTDHVEHRLFGYDQGVTGGLLDLPSFNKYFPAINPEDPAIEGMTDVISQRSTNQGIAVASYNLGCFCGAILTIFIGNPLGRRRTIFCGCVTMATGALLQATSFHLPQFIIARIVTGIGNGMNTSTVPTWQSESSKAHDRGKMVMIEGMLITAGITLSYWINYGEDLSRSSSKVKPLMPLR